MPQISPLSWILIPSFFFILFFIVMIGIWWKVKVIFFLDNCKISDKNSMNLVNVWFW